MIGRPARGLRIDTAETQFAQIKRLDKDLDHADRIVLADPVSQAVRKKRALAAIQTLDKALHQNLPTNPGVSYQQRRFYTPRINRRHQSSRSKPTAFGGLADDWLSQRLSRGGGFN